MPLQKGQISWREPISNDVLVGAVRAHEPLSIDRFDNPYSTVPEPKQLILNRWI